MRTAFINELIELARSHPRIFLIVGDLGYSVVEPFAKEFPDRFLNAGVAEQNMTGMAAGLASEGYHVFTYSIANFPTFRCAEQIRNDIAYHNLPVTVVSVGGGFAYGSLGYSHHAVQDMALLRTFPGLLIAAPGDPVETRSVLRYLSGTPQPSYLRLGKAGEPLIHLCEFEVLPGKLVFSPDGNPAAKNLIITTGATLKLASEALAETKASDWRIASLPLWSSRYNEELSTQLKNYAKIITVEDHLRAGGFGSFIRETLDEFGLAPQIRSVALSEAACGYVASQQTLNTIGGVSVEILGLLLQSTAECCPQSGA
jgi:transketolase